jgi:hypothetical protein
MERLVLEKKEILGVSGQADEPFAYIKKQEGHRCTVRCSYCMSDWLRSVVGFLLNLSTFPD